ncbi:MAG: hypothetical protein FWG38_00630 [Defluviitaleaceae bacterium]|nr:hypothetical protein [Defluviitaleaceae bacterium]
MKIIFLLFVLFAMAMFTACTNADNPAVETLTMVEDTPKPQAEVPEELQVKDESTNMDDI